MLNLESDTTQAWLSRALGGMDEILLDHAHCEKKAASTALGLIFRYPKQHHMLRTLSELAREELEHFEIVLGLLKSRGIAYDKQKPSPYASQLLSCVNKQEPQRLVDTLLCCSLIEARSCERMQLLAENLEDEELAQLYQSLLASEARHHTSYVSMAIHVMDEAKVRTRLKEIAQYEAELIAEAPPMVRMHT